MIGQLFSSSPYITVGSPMHTYISNSGQSAGQTRWNTQSQCLEVFDGAMWHNMITNAYVDLSVEATELLQWAKKKRNEEQQLESLMAQHPGLKSAYEQFEIMKKLVQVEQAPV